MRRQIGVSSYLLLPGNLLSELGGLLLDGIHHRPLSTTSPWKLLEWPVGDGGGEEWKGVEVRSESRSKLGRRSCRRGARPGDTLPVPMARGGPLLHGCTVGAPPPPQVGPCAQHRRAWGVGGGAECPCRCCRRAAARLAQGLGRLARLRLTLLLDRVQLARVR
jgi:hypothetical protein